MKKIRLIAFPILAFFVCSCSSDDSPTTSGELTGKWYNKETRFDGQVYPYEDHESCGKDYIKFNADGSGEFIDIYECNPYSEPFTYTRSGNSITVTTGDGPETATIVELSSTTLKVKLFNDYDGDGDDDMAIEVYTRD